MTPLEPIKPIVAIIDDDENIRSIARAVLRDKYDVITAHNGAAGIKLLKSHSPHLIFLDINMPDMNGLEVLQEILKISSGIKVIMFSGKSSKDNIKEAIKIGAKGFVTKPFSAETLLQHAEKALVE
jgi:DNA-binding NtrC family response regulator